MNKSIKISPKNLLADWGEFEDWESGDSAEPTGWTKSGTPTIAKESTEIKFGSYALKLIGTSTSQKLYRAIPDGTDYQGRTISLGCWVKTSGAGVTITIDDGVGTSSSSAHTGGGGWEFLSIIRKLDVAATKLQVDLNIPNGVTAYYDGAIVVEGETIFTNLEDTHIFVEDWKPVVDIKSQKFTIARREGIYIPSIQLGSRAVNIKGYVAGSDYSNTRVNFDNLLKAVLSWKDDGQMNLYLFDDRVLEVFLDGLNWEYLSVPGIIRYNLKFVAPDPAMRFISKLRKKQVISSSPTEFNFAYNGILNSKPIIYFIADQSVAITSCKLENLTTGESMSFSATVSAGNTLEIDCDNLTVKNNGVDSIGSFTGDFLKLIRGTNYLKFTGSLCTIKIDWFDKWLS